MRSVLELSVVMVAVRMSPQCLERSLAGLGGEELREAGPILAGSSP